MKRQLRPFVVEVKRSRKAAAGLWDATALLPGPNPDSQDLKSVAASLFPNLKAAPREEPSPVSEDGRRPQILPSLLRDDDVLVADAPVAETPVSDAPVAETPKVRRRRVAKPAPPREVASSLRKEAPSLFAEPADEEASLQAALPFAEEQVPALPLDIEPTPVVEPKQALEKQAGGERKKPLLRRLRQPKAELPLGQRWRRRLPALIR